MAKPPKKHRCWPQTEVKGNGGIMQRCPCGAARFFAYADMLKPRTPAWVQRNSRPKAVSTRKGYRRPLWMSVLKKVKL